MIGVDVGGRERKRERRGRVGKETETKEKREGKVGSKKGKEKGMVRDGARDKEKVRGRREY